MQVNKNNITQFLTATNMSFMIPVYQRNYDWSESNCKQLWSDLWYVSQSCGARTHFLGTICSKTINGHEKTIIDGQQRITTVTLLVKAMHDYVENKEFKRDLDSSFIRNNGYGVAPNHKVKLHLNRRDNAIYNKLLESDEFTEPYELDREDVDSHIYKNYAYFYQCIDGLNEVQIADLRAALDRIIIVDLDVENENPQEIFESLNSTGLDLTDVDLLRNYLLMSLEYEMQVRLYDEYWFKIEENVHPDNMVRFFVDYLIFVKKSDAVMIRGRRAHVNENNLYVAFKEYYQLLSGESGAYKSHPSTTEKLLEDMYCCSRVYRRLVFKNDVDMNSLNAIDQVIYSIVYLNGAVQSRPVLLYVMDKLDKGLVSEVQALEMLKACLSMVVRSKIVGNTGFNGQFAGNMLLRMSGEQDRDVVDSFWISITSGSGKFSFPSDKEFIDALVNRPIFDVLRAKGTKYLLYSLEQVTPAAKGLPRYDDAFITIEHIMPKMLSEEWQGLLGDGAVHHDDYLNKLGNLTLTSNNSEMSNKPFGDKQEWYRESSFPSTRKLANFEDWSIDRIRSRSERLAKRCAELWAIPERYQSKSLPEEEPSQKRRPKFRFSMIGLCEGDEVCFLENASKTATVYDDTRVMYEGEVYSLSRLAAILLDRDYANVAGPQYFTYEGQTLSELRDEVEANMF